MLERGLHQGTGLLQNRPWARTRVAAVATAPDAASLDTLWRLCALLQSEGTSVVVLDASVPEHEANPGLEQLLTSTSLCTLPSAPTRLDDGAPGSLAVLPAARGLQHGRPLFPRRGARQAGPHDGDGLRVQRGGRGGRAHY